MGTPTLEYDRVKVSGALNLNFSISKAAHPVDIRNAKSNGNPLATKLNGQHKSPVYTPSGCIGKMVSKLLHR